MKQEQTAILNMLVCDKITVAEADELLDALHDSYRSETSAAQLRKPVPDTAVDSTGNGPVHGFGSI